MWVFERRCIVCLFIKGARVYAYMGVSGGLPWWLRSKEFACHAGDIGDKASTLGQEDSLEEDMAIHSSILAWRIPWTWMEEPDRVQSMGFYSPKSQT